jgi:hypothetical protein
MTSGSWTRSWTPQRSSSRMADSPRPPGLLRPLSAPPLQILPNRLASDRPRSCTDRKEVSGNILGRLHVSLLTLSGGPNRFKGPGLHRFLEERFPGNRVAPHNQRIP